VVALEHLQDAAAFETEAAAVGTGADAESGLLQLNLSVAYVALGAVQEGLEAARAAAALLAAAPEGEAGWADLLLDAGWAEAGCVSAALTRMRSTMRSQARSHTLMVPSTPHEAKAPPSQMPTPQPGHRPELSRSSSRRSASTPGCASPL